LAHWVDVMKKLVFIVAALAMGTGMGTGAAFAQTPVAPNQYSIAVTSVQNWTMTQWNAAKMEWAKDKARWDGCQQQSTDQKLTGRKSWSFLYACMSS
jgi:hypothetical protein